MKKYTTTQQNYVSEGLNQDTQLRTHIRKMLGIDKGKVTPFTEEDRLEDRD